MNDATERIKEDKFLGREIQDKVTGFRGICTGKAIYLYGCTQYSIVPKAKEDKLGEANWFDEGRVTVVGIGIVPKEVQVEKNGGPNRDAPKL